MKRSFLGAALLFIAQIAFTYDETMFSGLVHECCKQVGATDKKSVAASFYAFNMLRQEKKSINDFLNDQFIQGLFDGSTQGGQPGNHQLGNQSTEPHLQGSLNQAQRLMLGRLYVQFFSEHIKNVQSLIEVLTQAKEHWQQELFYETLPLFRRNVTRWGHDKSYRTALIKRIQILQDVEDKMSSMLGIALHGYYQISKIHTINGIYEHVLGGIMPLYQHYNIPLGNFEGNVIPANRLFQDAKWFLDRTQEDMKNFKEIVEQHKKPHHIVRHKVAYAVAACGVIAALCAYKKYEDQVPYYQKKGKDVLDDFIRDYITYAIAAAKKFFWDRNESIIKKVPSPDPLPMSELVLPGFSKPDPLPPINNYVSKVDITGITKDLNSYAGAFDKIASSVVDDANRTAAAAAKYLTTEVNEGKRLTNQGVDYCVKKIDNLEEIVNRDGKVTMFMVAVFPTIGIAYGLHHLSHAGYNRFIKHDTWYKPMSTIVRSMDMLLNKIIYTKERSFCDDGKMHLLILRLKSYMYCLSNEELFLFKDDISQLLSFDLSYEQKHSVLQRMYKTYEFLK